MRSMTYSHGTLGSLWIETDARARVIVKTAGALSAVARNGLLDDALADMARQSKIPASVLRALIVRKSTSWPRRMMAGIMGFFIKRKRYNG